MSGRNIPATPADVSTYPLHKANQKIKRLMNRP